MAIPLAKRQKVVIQDLLLVDDGWSRPPQLFIDSLASRLKRTGRWAMDGRSLRQLNKFWCSQMNNHIEAVNPHKSKWVLPTESQALLKFPNLTSLDADEFLSKASVAELCDFADQISSLTSLRHLSVKLTDLYLLDFDCLESLTQLTSLHIKQEFETWTELEMLSKLHLLKLKCDCSSSFLERLMIFFPSLRHLDASVKSFSGLANLDLTSLNALESVKIFIDFPPSILEWLWQLTSLVSLRDVQVHDQAREMKQLLRFPKLVDLGLEERSPDWEMSDSISKMVAKLTSLRFITFFSRCRRLKDLIGTRLDCIRRLALSYVRFLGEDIDVLNSATQLTSMTLHSCTLKLRGEHDLSCFSKLKCLSLTGQSNLCPSSMKLSPATFSELISLKIKMTEPCKRKDWMKLISKLKQLQDLSLSFLKPLNLCQVSQLEDLCNLRSFDLHNVEASVALNLNLCVRKWTLLESLTCKAVKGTTKVRNAYEKIRRGFPNLKLEIKPSY